MVPAAYPPTSAISAAIKAVVFIFLFTILILITSKDVQSLFYLSGALAGREGLAPLNVLEYVLFAGALQCGASSFYL